MNAKQISFVRPHRFVEGSTAFTPAQIAAAAYKVVVAADKAAQQSFEVPAALLTAPASTAGAPVVVPFSAIGFTPVAGVKYVASVVVTLDGVDSAASAPVTFTNSLTPAVVDKVYVS